MANERLRRELVEGMQALKRVGVTMVHRKTNFSPPNHENRASPPRDGYPGRKYA
jgi:hypothetical protein